jgi:hypothetical protein
MSSCCFYLVAPGDVVNPLFLLAAYHITPGTHLWDVRLLDKAPRTGTVTKELDTGKKDPDRMSYYTLGYKVWGGSLLRVISRIREEAGENAANNPIPTTYHNTILVHIHELLIKEKLPYSMHQFMLTMGIYLTCWCLPIKCHVHILEIVW